MFLPNMTDKELLDQFLKEKDDIDRRVTGFFKREGRRKLQKANVFPFVQFFETKMKSGNCYLLTLDVMNKSDAKNNMVAIGYTAIIQRDVEPLTVNFSKYKERFCVERFYGHFFSRYRERMNLQGSTRDLIKRYMKHNILMRFTPLEKDDEGQHFIQSTDEGISLGVITPAGECLVKTFVPIQDVSYSKYMKQAEAMRNVQELKEKLYGNKFNHNKN